MIVQYRNINELNPLELAGYIESSERARIGKLKVGDLINKEVVDMRLNDVYHNWLFPRGVYTVFNEDGQVRYVGQSRHGFYGRMMGHLHTEPSIHFGWNAILRKLGSERTGKPQHELTKEDHENDLQTLLRYDITFLSVGYDELIEARWQLNWLEKYIMKSFREKYEDHMLNTRIGWLSSEAKSQTIKKLLSI